MRGQIVVESEVLRGSQADALEAQRSQAVQDVMREGTPEQSVNSAAEPDGLANVSQENEVPGAAPPQGGRGSPSAEVIASLPEGAPGSLLRRFRQAMSLPEEPDTLVYVQVIGIIRLIGAPRKLHSSARDAAHQHQPAR